MGSVQGYHFHFYPRPPRGGRLCKCDNYKVVDDFYPRPPRGGRPGTQTLKTTITNFYPRPPRGGRPRLKSSSNALLDFYPRPPRGGRRERHPMRHRYIFRFLSTPSARRATSSVFVPSLWISNFYPRPPRGGRRGRGRCGMVCRAFLSTPSARRATQVDIVPGTDKVFLSTPSARRATVIKRSCPRSLISFLSTPSARRATHNHQGRMPAVDISIHALREEGDSKNGEKHLRFCFIIKRSAQIWKSLSKNIRKKSRDLHRTA